MADWGTYVAVKPPIPVRAWVRGFQVDALALGWSGTMVHLRWKGDMGTHLGWVPAPDVERR